MKKKWIGILIVILCLFTLLIAAAFVTGTFRRLADNRGQNTALSGKEENAGSGEATDQTDGSESDKAGAGQTDGSESDKAGTDQTESPKSGKTGTDEMETSETDMAGMEEPISVTDERQIAGQTRESETASGQTEQTEEAEKLVVGIDPGHQGNWIDMSATEPMGPGSSEMKAKSTTGTQGSYSGVPEYQLNLDISLKLRTELEQRGYEVVLTREDNDTAISNSERAIKAYQEGADIYVRIHANGSDDPSVSGALAMVPSESNPYVGDLAADSYLLADCILNGYCAETAFPSLGIQYYDNMTGINWSEIPVMILEMGFMTNESDDLQMQDASMQEKMVDGIADGIDSYFLQKGMTASQASPDVEPDTARSLTMDGLAEQINQEIASAVDAGERWAVSVKSLASGSAADINGDIQMKSASVIKAFIMAAVYDRVCYPASEDRYIYFYESYDGELRELITSMITASDNNAANTIIERLGDGDAQKGMEIVNQFCRENGYTSTSLGREFLEENPSGDNYTSANDCMNLLESIYNGTCVCAEASGKMYEFLKQQTRTGKIPSGLPDSAAVAANKTGELYGEYGDYVENDIAIVDNGSSAYVLCILSEGLADDTAAVERIRSISGLVYQELG